MDQAAEDESKQKINDLIEHIFSITINSTPNEQLIFLRGLASSNPNTTLINMKIMKEALSERLSLKSPARWLVPNNIPSDETHAITNDKILLYLYRSYQRLMTRNQKECEEIKQLILRSGSELLRKPAPHSSLSEQWLELLKIYYDDTEKKCEFLSKIVAVVYSENDLLKRKSFHFIFDDIFDKVVKRTATITIEKWAFLILNGFVIDGVNPKLGQLIVAQFTQNTQSLDIVSNLLTILLEIDIVSPVQFEQKVLIFFL